MDIVRTGRISSLNYAAGTARVTYEDKDKVVTREMPLLSPYQIYFMPKAGDPVFVLHLPNGSTAGIILGRYWCAENVPPEAGSDLYRQDLERGGNCYVKHTEGGVLQIYAPNGIELIGDTKIIGNTETTGAAKIQGATTIQGDTTIQGAATLNSTATIQGATSVAATITAVGDIIGAGKSLSLHTHTGNLGAPTSAPN